MEKKLLQTKFDFHWQEQAIKYLGIHLNATYDSLYEQNYVPLLASLKSSLQTWGKYQLSWFGRNSAVKITLLPRIFYLFRVLPVHFPERTANFLQKATTQFICDNKRPRIKLDIMTKP